MARHAKCWVVFRKQPSPVGTTELVTRRFLKLVVAHVLRKDSAVPAELNLKNGTFPSTDSYLSCCTTRTPLEYKIPIFVPLGVGNSRQATAPRSEPCEPRPVPPPR